MKYIRVLVMMMALMFGAVSGAWAQLTSGDIEFDVKPSVSAGSILKSVSGREVTLTVTPATGYYIKASDIVVEKLVNTGKANAPKRRTAEITDFITGKMYKDDGTTEITIVEGGSSARYVFTVPADYDGAYVTATFHVLTDGDIIRITASTNLGETPDMTKHYILVEDVGASVVAKLNNSTAFSGIFEAEINPETQMPYRITDLDAPLFTTLTGTVKNLVLEDVSISSGDASGNTGAIACTANGAARIYNVGILSGSVGGTTNTGGLVGFLDGTARVVNCYSYADITSGTNKGGIVGNNNVASKQSNVATMVMNCMFYGTIATGGTVSPVYGGQNIDNKNSGGLATYNYYLYRTDLIITNDKYNCALAVEEKFLNRFELYRQLLNSNKKLAAIYATGSASKANEMAKWVLETADRSIEGRTPYPYPILKAQGNYPSIINYDVENAPDSTSVGRNHGGKLGKTLSVTISCVGDNAPDGASITKGSLTLQRTDKDFDRFNFNYDKVQLPYYNDIGKGNYTGNRVVTGWKITSITGGTAGTFSAADEFGGYNFADRKCTAKDIYKTSGRVFSQGAYFDVPYGVTGITIEPYWGVAAYVSDQYYDVVYKEQNNNNYAGQSVNVSSAGLGTQATNNTDITINGSTQKVYTSINNARSALNIPTDVNSGKTVYDYAVVLVGNVHQAGPLAGDYTPYTITSVDMDKDNEPDYSFIFSHYNRQPVSPIRFDFLNVVGTAQAQKPNGTSILMNVSIFKPKGWFEVTNTCSIYFVQFEGDNGNKTSAPIILLGGAFDQFTSTQNQEVTTSQQYIHLGSNCWFKAFGNGTHSDGFSFTKHVPVSVTGGDFDGFYLSGVYRPDAGIQKDDAECYISSGRFNEVAGAAQQMIDGDVHWQIYNADITNFYGGGINAAKPITGDITVDITNSYVGTYCGGPKFGDMQKAGTTFTTTYSKNKEGTQTGTYSSNITKDGKVTTNAIGCWFNKFFGAGYGGTSYSELKFADATSYNFTTLANNYTDDRGMYFTGQNTAYKSDYGNKGPGVATDFSYEFFIWSTGIVGARFYVKYASFSLAQCNDVESKLKKCIIENNFYGGGSIGKVDGTATSELEDCEVKGSVYGGGYSASLPTIPVRSGGFTTIPKFNNQSGMFEPGVLSDTEDFDWASGTLTENNTALNTEGGKHDIYTGADLTTLGEVGETNLTIKGTTTVAESVYGGGEESGVGGDTEVTVNSGFIGAEGRSSYGYRYGNVYGGGKGKIDNEGNLVVSSVADLDAGLVKGNTSVTINGTKETTKIVHNVYGGGAVGSVGTFTRDANGNPTACTSGGQATVTINGGTIGHDRKDSGMVNGSSRGWEGNPDGSFLDQLAWVNNASVVIGDATTNDEDKGPAILGSVYGGGENGHNYSDGSVTINKGTIGNAASSAASYDCGNVYGAGCGTDTYWIDANGNGSKDEGEEHYNPMAGIVWGNTEVNINGGKVLRNIYGGGAMGSVGNDTDAESGKTTINIFGGIIGRTEDNDHGHVFGGPKGDINDTEVVASVKETSVNILPHPTDATKDPQIWGSVFGGGEAGVIKGSVVVNMNGGTVKKDVYGGGALADTQTSNWDATANNNAGGWADTNQKSALNTTTVRLTGGTILGEAYGGGLGQKTGVNGATSDIEAYVYGDVLLDLNGTTTMNTTTGKPTTEGTLSTDPTGCVVEQIFGCNNINGSPKGDVMVHVYATQNKLTETIVPKFIREKDSDTEQEENETNEAYVTRLKGILTGKIALAEALGITVSQDDKDLAASESAEAAALKTAITDLTTSINAKPDSDRNAVRYDMVAVYGGGNRAAYVPVPPYTESNTTGAKSQVIIEGCDETSIETVYGGGNAAAVPETNVEIKAAYEIQSVFGGGNGKDKILLYNELIDNPGADVGQYNNGTTTVTYGTGNANTLMKGGYIHEAYGGSNTKGVVKGDLNQTSDPEEDCELILEKIVGAGKYADIDGDVIMTLSCQPSTKVPLLFAGADEANVNGNITLNITNGNFGKVFGGNNLGGAVKGKITVNVEETGCQPIKIDELYLGGYQAAYSIYGYYESDETHAVTGKKILKPRTAEMHAITDPTAEGYTAPVTNPTTDATHTFPYAQPELNIISCTYIGNVFGGGLGEPAKMYANPTVNVNMVKGNFGDDEKIGVPAVMTTLNLPNTENTNHLGIIGNVYGGGDAADIEGNTAVNIATEDGKSAYIIGNVFGGGKGSDDTYQCEKGMINGGDGTHVTIGNGLVKGNVYGGGEIGRVEHNTEVTIGTGDGAASDGTSTPEIQGDVFGAGRGLNTHGYAALVRGNTTVTVQGNAKIAKSIYGGGEIASVGKYKVKKGDKDPSDAPDDVEIGMPYSTNEGGVCNVIVKGYAEIGPDNMQMKATGGPDDTGYVFGAGKGILPYEKLGNDNIPKRMTFDNSGDYYEEYTAEWYGNNSHPDTNRGTDYVGNYLKYIETLALATTTNVTIGGHAFIKGSVYGGSENGHVQADTHVKIQEYCQIGAGDGVTERYNEEDFINPATAAATDIEAKAEILKECAHWDYKSPYEPYDRDDATTGGAVTATDGHTFYGNVFGGGSGLYPYKKSDNSYEWLRSAGRVYGNTNVEITGGHILTSVYGGCELADVGNGVSVETNKGRCFVKMSGGTLGVPRTLAQIAAHPVTCYLFGAGKGDQRVHFNQWTNVGKVRVEINDSISQPIIYGSAFGGGEDGHVLGDVSIDIKTMNGNDPVIGTWGTSYVDGNVFGGGRGFGGDALSAGVVSGNVYINISGGKMLGSIYGGGRLGSVGTYLVPSDKTQKYGQFIPDGKQQTINEVSIGNGDVDVSDATGVTHGHVTINISGGTIGNNYEHIIPDKNDNVAAGIATGKEVASWTDISDPDDSGYPGDWQKWKTYKHIPNTEFEYDSDRRIYRLTHTKGGNVFAGAMGRFYGLDGSTVLPHWLDLGKVKSTKLNISGSAVIKSSIYGGGELGWTSGTHKTSDNKDVSTEISITGGTIGSEITDNNVVQYTYGSVFGGGYGSAQEMLTDANSNKTYPKFQAGRVMNSTAVTMSSGTVKASVYGGGELANVGYGFYSYSQDGLGEKAITQASDAANTYVKVSGGTIGRAPITAQTGNTYFGGATMGNVYGGGSGNKTISRCGLVLGNTYVNISGTARIYHNVYGGGAYGSVGDYEYTTGTNDPVYPGIVKVFGINDLHTSGTGTANVTITGGTIGYDGKDNGMVFGSSRGDVQGEGTRDDYMAWVNDGNVTIGTSGQGTTFTTPLVKGSVYGSGENGHVFHDTDVKIYSGTIGIDNADTSVEGYTVTSGGTTYYGPEYPSRGNVYGGGCGTDTYTKDAKIYFNPTAGVVKGNTTVTMTGGHVVRAVYGGGSMGSVGTFTEADATYHTSHEDVPVGKPYECAENTGLCSVTISGGKIGPTSMSMPNYYGNVFGAGRGEMHDPAVYPNLETSAYFNKTKVLINGNAFVKGSVYGGAESGHVLNDTEVEINGNCQIGCGKNATNRYGDDVWASSYVPTDAVDLECVSWPYRAPYTPYDKFADENGKYPDNSSADNAHSTGTDGHTFYGNVFGGGSGSTPYAPGKWLPTAGWVEGNTTVEIKGGHILTSVYGGNELSDVGAGGVRKMTDLTNETADMFYDITKSGGKCTVKMIGGTIGVPRTLSQIAAHPLTCYLFGAGKGDQRIFFNKTTNVKEVEVEVSGGRIYGSVFGGGEDGHVMKDVKMTIMDNAYIGTWGTSYVDGNVFGGGRGFSGEALTAGNVGGSVQIDIEGGNVLGSVYGGGRLGSVGYGLYLVDETVGTETPYGVMRPNNVDDRGKDVSNFNRGHITINISGGTIGNDIEYKANPSATDKLKMPTTTFDSQNHLLYTRGGNVFAGCMGRLYSLKNELLPLWPKLGRCKQTTLNITGGTIKSNVYGGAELGVVEQKTSVNITGGQVGTQIGTGSGAYYYGSVFGSGKGSVDNITYPSTTPAAEQIPISEAGTTRGNVEVHLNKDVAANAKGGIVRKVFGCNDMNGTPKGDVLVHIHATQSEGTDNIATKAASGYDVDYVFGGGNNADYVPTVSGAKQSTEVIIEGCDLTSIEEVYGGGFGAATPGTKVEVRGTKIINNLFGGGYGAGENNPGANVGFRTAGKTAYANGEGKAVVQLMAGTVNNVFGGSNTNGDIRGGSSITNVPTLWQQGDGQNAACCENLKVGEIYGGGKSAPMEGGAEIVLGCMPDDWIGEIYAGAQDAEVRNDVSLTITSGKFERVFGGNKSGGTISGSIEVNIEECPTCGTPIIIGELYGGGNLAPYTIGDAYTKKNPNYPSPRVNVRSFTSIGTIYGGGLGDGAVVTGNPMVNINVGMVRGGGQDYPGANNAGTLDVKLYPHVKKKIGVIGNVFGGGNAAPVNGNTYVNIGVHEYEKLDGIIAGETNVAGYYIRTGTYPNFEYTPVSLAQPDVTYYQRQDDGYTVVSGVSAGTDVSSYYTRSGDSPNYVYTPVSLAQPDTIYCLKVEGADIRGNVYGGGNAAAVTGSTNVNIGKK